MNNELVFLQKEKAVTSSRVVAEYFKKQHKHVLDAIDTKKSAAENSALLNTMFFETTYIASNGKTNREVIMTRDGFSLLAMGFTGKKALKFQINFIQAFNDMEAQLKKASAFNLPQTYVEALEGLLETHKKLETATRTIEEQAPKVSYYDRILSSSSSMTPSAIAKDYGMSAVALNRLLHEEKIQYRVDGMWVLYAKHANKGWTTSETSLGGMNFSKMHTRWTQKGRLMIHNLLD
ncbi:MAG: phage antirepressor KilAC domain-containing protein, partial [Phocaeicola sp.]